MNNNYNNPAAMLIQMLQNGGNPQQILSQLMASQNPQIQAALQQLQVAQNQARQSGMTMQQYVMQYAKQNNIDMQGLMNNLGIR